MDLIDRFLKLFPEVPVDYLCGDREFVGKEWLTYLLLEPNIPFRLRIKANHKISDGSKSLKASVVFAHLDTGQSLLLSRRRWVWGRSVYVGALRLESGELLIVISAHKGRKCRD